MQNAENLVLHCNQFIYREGSFSLWGYRQWSSPTSLCLSAPCFSSRIKKERLFPMGQKVYCQVLTSKISEESSQKIFFKAELRSFCFPFHASKREFIFSTSSFKQMEKLRSGE